MLYLEARLSAESALTIADISASQLRHAHSQASTLDFAQSPAKITAAAARMAKNTMKNVLIAICTSYRLT